MDDNFGHWLAGFADGEGCFFIGRTSKGARFCLFRIGLHYEDEPILRQIAERTGLGRVWVGKAPSQPSARAMWTVDRKPECVELVELFRRCPLRAKKRKDFELWAQAVEAWSTVSRGVHVPAARKRMDECREQLRQGRPSRGKAWV